MDTLFRVRSVVSNYTNEDVLFPGTNRAEKGDFNNNRVAPEYVKLFANTKPAAEETQRTLIGSIGTIPSSDWLTSRTFFGKTKVLGRGAYGIVEKGVYLPTHLIMAKKTMIDQPQALNLAVNEANMLRQVEATNYAPKCYGIVVDDPQRPAIMMEYLKNYVTLSDVLLSRKGLTEFQRLAIAREVTRALYKFHRLGIHHNDLKSDNIMVNMKKPNSPKIKIIDFGNASKRVVKLDMSDGPVDRSNHLAPELRNGNYSCESSDIYSLGMVLLTLSFGSNSTHLRFLADLCTKEDPGFRPGYQMIFRFLNQSIDICLHAYVSRK